MRRRNFEDVSLRTRGNFFISDECFTLTVCLLYRRSLVVDGGRSTHSGHSYFGHQIKCSPVDSGSGSDGHNVLHFPRLGGILTYSPRGQPTETIMDTSASSVTESEDSLSFEDQYNEDCLQSADGSVQVQMRDEEREPESDTSISGTRDEEEDLILLDNLTLEERTGEETAEFMRTVTRLARSKQGDRLVAVLMNRLSVDNCVFIFHVASICEQERLQAAAHDMICTNFVRVSETSVSFPDLSLEDLSLFVFSDFLHATEEQVFHAIVRWVKADLPGRQNIIPKLLPAVRVNSCSLRFLLKAKSHFLVQKEHLFLVAAQKRVQWLVCGGLIQDNFGSDLSSRAGDRHILFVMGGLHMVKTVETFEYSRGYWVTHNFTDAPSNWTWVCSVGHKILVLEGSNRRFNSFDVLTRSWSQLKALPNYRLGSSGSSSHNHVYVMGGEEPHAKRCDRYDVRTDQWEEMAPLIQGREWAASACHAGKLYCSGGLSMTWNFLSSLETFDLRKGGQWSRRRSMETERTNHSLVSCGRFLWAIGGWNGKTFLSAVEKYDELCGQWSFVRALPTPRSDHYASVLCGRIYVIGGETADFTNVPLVDVYDVEQDQWASVAPLRDGRFWHGSCVVRSLPDWVAGQYEVPISED